MMDIADKFKRVWLVDSFSPASHHEQYNASMAIVLTSVFGRIIYLVGDGQLGSIEAKWREAGFVPDGIEFRRLKISASGSGRKHLFRRHLKSAWYNLAALLRAGRDDLVIYNFNNPVALLPLKLLNIFARRRVVIITHGELEYIAHDPSLPRSCATRLAGKPFARSLRFGRNGAAGRNIYYLVLGDSIKKNLEALDLVPAERIISLDHPWLFNKKATRRKKGSGGIATIGIQNFPTAGDTAGWIRRLAAAHPDVTFSIIGMRSSVKGKNIENNATGVLRTRGEHEAILSRMDAMIFLYSGAEYRLKASGAIFDCIELGIPVIAVRNDYFEHLFRLHGPLGYLYNDPGQLREAIPGLLKADHTRLRRNIEAARAYHSPENLTGALREQLTRLFRT